MAVITRYIVIRNGVELDEVFEDKKEAEAYDKMLDAADRLSAFIKERAVEIDLTPDVIDELSVFLAKNGPEVSQILKGVKKPPAPAKPKDKPPEKPASEKEKKKASADKSSGRGKSS